MRKVFFCLFLIVAACSGPEPELAPTPPTTQPAASTTPAPPTTPTTTAIPTTTTTTAPTTTTSTLPELLALQYESVATVDFPIHLVAWMPSADLVATKDGQIYVFDGAQLSESPVLDIGDQVRNEGERGLLSIAVDPEDSSRVFVHYSANDGDTVVSEFIWGGDTLGDERVLLRLDQPAGNHNGGMLQFGPDRFLYLGLGDGGGGNDTFGNGQNTGTLLGGIVRIDVVGGADPSLFQYGLRNPWRFWIDGDLVYVADVGQNAFEEVSVVPLQEGVNHGWPITEGLHCFNPSSGCDTAGLTLPVLEVEHGDAGTCSITGGVVYRGSAIPEIDGHYFYSDYCGGYLRSFRYEGGEATNQTDWTDQVGVPGRVASFGVGGDGEIYVLTTEGVFRLGAVR